MWNDCKKQKRKKNVKLKWEILTENYDTARMRENGRVRIMRMGGRMLRWELWECKNEREWDQSCKPPSLLSQAMNQPGASFTPLPSWTWETSLWLADCPIHLTNQKTVLLISLYHRIRKDKNFPDNKIFTVYGLSRQFFWMGQYCLIEEEEKLSEDFAKTFGFSDSGSPLLEVKLGMLFSFSFPWSLFIVPSPIPGELENFSPNGGLIKQTRKQYLFSLSGAIHMLRVS